MKGKKTYPKVFPLISHAPVPRVRNQYSFIHNSSLFPGRPLFSLPLTPLLIHSFPCSPVIRCAILFLYLPVSPSTSHLPSAVSLVIYYLIPTFQPLIPVNVMSRSSQRSRRISASMFLFYNLLSRLPHYRWKLEMRPGVNGRNRKDG